MSNYRNNNIFSALPVITKNILIINFLVWLACNVFIMTGRADLSYYLGLHFPGTPGFHIYQFITYMFTQVSFMHLFFNMFAVFMFGTLIERTWGQKRYLTYYMVTGIGAAIIQLIVSFLTGGFYSITIGASGAVFGILLAFGMMFPNMPLYIMFIPIPIKAKWCVIGYGVIELFSGIANRSGDNVAHFAHLGGMLFGILLILYWRNKDKKNGFYY